jgi:hypothetical protein
MYVRIDDSERLSCLAPSVEYVTGLIRMRRASGLEFSDK